MADQHVVKRPDGWAVLGAGNGRDTSHHDTQREAIDAAKDIAQRKGADVVVHDRNGLIREKNTYGKEDRHPPKG